MKNIRCEAFNIRYEELNIRYEAGNEYKIRGIDHLS